MSNRNKQRFTIRINGRKGHFWRAAAQPYQNCEISAGSVSGLDPDTIYLRFDRDNDNPTTFVFRPDEALAIINVLSGALWSASIFELDGGTR